MNRRQFLLLAVVVIAFGLNLWHWWPQPHAAKENKGAVTDHWPLETLRVQVAVDPGKDKPAVRDLFQARVAAVAKPAAPKPAEPPPAPPAKTPEQLAEEAARAELAQIKLVGVVFRGEKGEAFMVKGDQAFIAQHGSKVGERFTVDAVNPDSVSLKDPITQVTGKISVSGK